jgi:hypothetical protein
MQNKKLILRSLVHALAAVIYILLVVLFLSNAEHTIGQANRVLAPMVFLLLLVISASVMCLLIFSKPITLYLENQKKTAWQMLLCTIGWLIVIFAITLAIIVIL